MAIPLKPKVGALPENPEQKPRSLIAGLKEKAWHGEAWVRPTNLQELAAKIQSGTYSVRDMYLFKALTGKSEPILKAFGDKLLADLHEVAATHDVTGSVAMLSKGAAADIRTRYEDELRQELSKP
jgi:hypothetical protein